MNAPLHEHCAKLWSNFFPGPTVNQGPHKLYAAQDISREAKLVLYKPDTGHAPPGMHHHCTITAPRAPTRLHRHYRASASGSSHPHMMLDRHCMTLHYHSSGQAPHDRCTDTALYHLCLRTAHSSRVAPALLHLWCNTTPLRSASSPSQRRPCNALLALCNTTSQGQVSSD